MNVAPKDIHRWQGRGQENLGGMPQDFAIIILGEQHQDFELLGGGGEFRDEKCQKI